jgi:subtilisin family serine protease
MASPHVAGTAALVHGSVPADANGNGRIDDEVPNALAASAVDIGAAGRDPLYGFGLVTVPGALAAAAATAPLVASVDRISYTATGSGKSKKDRRLLSGRSMDRPLPSVRRSRSKCTVTGCSTGL